MEHEYSFLYLLVKPVLDGLPEVVSFLNGDHIVMVTFVTLVMVILLPLLASRFKQENRGGLQQTFEVGYEALRGMLKQRVEHNPDAHIHIIAAFAMVVFTFNIMGAVPLFTTPTPNLNTTIGLALVAFFYYNAQGIKQHGPWGYAKTLMGPMPAIAPLMFAAELISHLARVLSLSLRLSASMSADHVVVGAFTILFPFLLPAPMVGLGMLMAGLQTFIFVMLNTVYIGGAVSEEH